MTNHKTPKTTKMRARGSWSQDWRLGAHPAWAPEVVGALCPHCPVRLRGARCPGHRIVIVSRATENALEILGMSFSGCWITPATRGMHGSTQSLLSRTPASSGEESRVFNRRRLSKTRPEPALRMHREMPRDLEGVLCKQDTHHQSKGRRQRGLKWLYSDMMPE